MSVYWKDIETDSGRWFGLALEQRHEDGGHRKPVLRVETSPHSRIRLIQDRPGEAEPLTRLWATLLEGYHGVYLLRSDVVAEGSVPASALASAVVERHAALPEPLRLPSWSRVFAQAVSEGPASFLYPGLWMFMGMSARAGSWDFQTQRLRVKSGQWTLERVREGLREDPVVFLDWWRHNGSGEVLNLRAPPEPGDGRVKWWRKKAREDALPPVLLWYLACLDAFVIVDGHCRLQAALLEDRAPQFLVAYSAYHQPVATDPVGQQRVLESLQRHAEETSRGLPHRKTLDTDSLNAILMAAFDDRPVLLTNTYGWPSRRPQALWLSEVEGRLAQLGRSELLSEFVDR